MKKNHKNKNSINDSQMFFTQILLLFSILLCLLNHFLFFPSIHADLHTYTCRHTHRHKYTDAHVHVHRYTKTQVCTQQTHTHTRAYTHTQRHTDTHTNRHTHRHKQTRRHTQIHIDAHTLTNFFLNHLGRSCISYSLYLFLFATNNDTLLRNHEVVISFSKHRSNTLIYSTVLFQLC